MDETYDVIVLGTGLTECVSGGRVVTGERTYADNIPPDPLGLAFGGG